MADAEGDEPDGARASLADELREAIEAGDLSVAYQPRARLASGQIVGVEALVRWAHPRYGSLPPDDFVPLAEQTGLIRPLTELVLERALRECRSWSELGLELSLAVNLSATSLLEPDLAEAVTEALERNGVPPRLLTLEITGTMRLADPVRSAEAMQALSDRGIRLSMDGFRDGYSSLPRFEELPVHELTVDKSFVLIMTVDPAAAAIVRSVIDVAGSLGVTSAAKGVEDPASLGLLATLGCDVVQGYHLSRPVAAPTLTAELVANGTALSGWMPAWNEGPRPGAP